MKTNINLVEIHPQQSNNEQLVDGTMVGANSLWPYFSIANTKLRRL
jgi:hypothetical protein